ncbi:MAG: 50S ribosomal protein L35 [Bdellovibrionales bacterium]|nr:50S ribosomal protein L35 [Bdellovibrionales bacterium]
MPKLKTKKAAAKRIRLTKTGKAKMKRSNLRHILTSKTTKSKRQSRTALYASETDQTAIDRMLPYGRD